MNHLKNIRIVAALAACKLEPQPGGGDSFREAYTVNLSYENPDIWGNAVNLELFASDSQIQTHRTVSNRTVRDEQTNEYQGFRSSIATPSTFSTTECP